eukprot:1828795-Rhodomonas_salina.1
METTKHCGICHWKRRFQTTWTPEKVPVSDDEGSHSTSSNSSTANSTLARAASRWVHHVPG